MTAILEQAEPATAAARPTTRNRRVATPGILAALLYTAITTAMLIAAYLTADHHFLYPLDDTYIGMAMAKNLALHGVWGVTPYGFSSSDSSLLFPLLLAGSYRLLGVNEYSPLLISWIFGLLSIFAAESILARFLDRKAQTFALLALVLATPLFVLGVIGMEASLQLLLTLLFLGWFYREDEREHLGRIGAITLLMVGARYEGLFFAGPACCLLLMRKRWKPGMVITFAAAIPVCAYAAWSIAHGGYWLPDSVAIKGVNLHHSVLGAAFAVLRRTAANALSGFHLTLLLAACGVAAASLYRSSPRRAIPLALIVGAGLLHNFLASIGGCFRYEAYLIAAALVALACAFPSLSRAGHAGAWTAVRLLAGAALIVLGGRSLAGGTQFPKYCRNVYQQQWQMARFLHSYDPHAAVAANDIGAINYFNDLHCLDLIGLANSDIASARRSGRFTTQLIAQQVAGHQVQIAMVYDWWFSEHPPEPVGGPALPKTWVRVAQWSIPERWQLGGRVVSFYAVDPRAAEGLRSALRQFDTTLPEGVTADLE